jgi:hypothetical protein
MVDSRMLQNSGPSDIANYQRNVHFSIIKLLYVSLLLRFFNYVSIETIS